MEEEHFAINGQNVDIEGRPIEDEPAVDELTGAEQPADDGPTAEEIAEGRARGKQLIDQMTAEDAEGFKDLQNLTLAMGLPAARALFHHMLAGSGIRGNTRREMAQEIDDFSPIKEQGCMTVDFFNQTTGKPDKAYLLLTEVDKTHDLGVQLAKLQPHVTAEKWPDVLRHLSMLLNIGRTTYGQSVVKHLDLVKRINKLDSDEACAPFRHALIDPANTTLFINPGWHKRVGFIIKLDAEVQEKLKKDAERARRAKEWAEKHRHLQKVYLQK